MSTESKKPISPDYYSWSRPEVRNLIPEKAQRILDLGCGKGILGKALKRERDCHVEGIEINPQACNEAKTNLDKAYQANLDREIPIPPHEDFDCIVAADILEHLINPWQLLNVIQKHLKGDGCIVASIPNIAHPSIIANLLNGRFPYEPAGILDITHLRFFTRSEIFKLFTQANLKIVKIIPFPNKQNPIQYILKAKKIPPDKTHADTTITICTRNCLSYTRQCIASLRKHTPKPVKIIVVDNGSTDGTVPFLRNQKDILTIENRKNLGFPAGQNQAIQSSQTKYYVIENNDIIFTSEWLERMKALAEEKKERGIIGCKSNSVAGYQKEKNTMYSNQEDLEKYVKNNIHVRKGMFLEIPQIFFVLALIKKEIFEKVGFFDERFGLGNFEDNDLCIRAQKAGYINAIAYDVFVHHYGSQTFKSEGIDYNRLFQKNQAIFMQKWNTPKTKG